MQARDQRPAICQAALRQIQARHLAHVLLVVAQVAQARWTSMLRQHIR